MSVLLGLVEWVALKTGTGTDGSLGVDGEVVMFLRGVVVVPLDIRGDGGALPYGAMDGDAPLGNVRDDEAPLDRVGDCEVPLDGARVRDGEVPLDLLRGMGGRDRLGAANGLPRAPLEPL